MDHIYPSARKEGGNTRPAASQRIWIDVFAVLKSVVREPANGSDCLVATVLCAEGWIASRTQRQKWVPQ